jgi:hypothetical protein
VRDFPWRHEHLFHGAGLIGDLDSVRARGRLSAADEGEQPFDGAGDRLGNARPSIRSSEAIERAE